MKPDVIIGYIDGYDAVHSEGFSKKDAKNHKVLYGMVLRGWRWESTTKLESPIKYGLLNPEEIILVKEHLRKKYGV